MDNTTQHELNVQIDDLLASSIGLLYDYMIKATKHDGKKRFKKLTDSKRHYVADMPAHDSSPIKVQLGLDDSEFRGKLDFTIFKKFLSHLVAIIAKAINSEDKIPLRYEEKGQRFLVSMPAALNLDNQLNILMLGIDHHVSNEITIELLFFDPDQFPLQDQVNTE